MNSQAVLEHTKQIVGRAGLSDDESSNFLMILKYTQQHSGYELNLGISSQYEFVIQNLIRAGESNENSPQTFALLKIAHEEANIPTMEDAYHIMGDKHPLVPLTKIISFENNVNEYKSALFTTYPYGTIKTIVIQNILSIKKGKINEIRTHKTTQYIMGEKLNDKFTAKLSEGDEAVSLSLTIVFPEESKKKVRAFTVYKKLGKVPNPELVGNSFGGDYPALNSSTLTKPTNIKTPSGANVRIGLGRLCTENDDYSYPVTSGHSDNDFSTDALLPLSGYFDFQGVIKLFDGLPKGRLHVFLSYVNGGVHTVYSTNHPQQDALGVLSGFTVPSSKRISWDWSDKNSDIFKHNDYLNFYKNQPQGKSIEINFELSVVIDDGSGAEKTGYGNFYSDPEKRTGQGFLSAPYLDIYWGCLIEGTKILLADGSLKEVEKFKGDGTEKVKTGKGVDRFVTATITGTEKFPCVTLDDDKDGFLMLTRDHPVVTDKGVILAKNLKKGDILITQNGKSTIINIGEKYYNGRIWNLEIGSMEEASRDETTFFADGFLVGDYSMQQHYCQENKKNQRKDPWKVLPPEWLVDYQNFINEAK